MEWAMVVGDAVLASATVGSAAIAARAGRHAKEAREVGQANSVQLEQVRRQTDNRQNRMIRSAVEQVAKEHRDLVTEAIADELVRGVLEAILSGHVEEWHPFNQQGEGHAADRP